jgi:glycosyltransferase involved in cell wall biosynthesis
VKLAVYLPALNESATIGAMLDSIPAHIPGITSLTKIVVDDGSTDGTGDIARRHGAEVVRHERNLGTGRAFMSGVQSSIASGADIIVSIDADGQFAATSIPELIAPILRHAADANVGYYAWRTLPVLIGAIRDYSPLKFFGSLSLFVFIVAMSLGTFVFVHWLRTGETIPYTQFITVSVGGVLLSVLLGAVALLADLIARLKFQVEEILHATRHTRRK